MPKKQPMRVIALAASKGGVGKSTLTASLAVRAARDSDRVALIDHDPQLSLQAWWRRRGGPNNPTLFEDVDSSAEAIELIAAEGWEWLFLDTPPSQLDRIGAVIACSDFVLIPTRPGIMDVEAVRITEDLCRSFRKPYAFILNMVAPNATNARVTNEVAKFLSSDGRTLLEPFITYRQSHSNAMFAGKTAGEVRDAAAKLEIDVLWQAVQAVVTKPKRVPA
jgi:chromosome partitioning protein